MMRTNGPLDSHSWNSSMATCPPLMKGRSAVKVPIPASSPFWDNDVITAQAIIIAEHAKSALQFDGDMCSRAARKAGAVWF